MGVMQMKEASEASSFVLIQDNDSLSKVHQ